MTQLKLVKESYIEKTDSNTVELVHYDTLIAIYYEDTKIMKVYRGLSPTSNRAIKYFEDFYKPDQVIDLNEGFKKYSKNCFSRPLEA